MSAPDTSSISALQNSIPSGFTAHSTAYDIINGIDLTGKNVIVTGGYSGIGLETVRVLAEHGATVFIPARDINKATKAFQGFKGKLVIEELDLADPKSIDSFVEQFLEKKIPLHILINNAGIMTQEHTLDSRGFESHFSVNHLGPFQLTIGLLPALRSANGARTVIVSSLLHKGDPIDFDDLHFNHKPYDTIKAYGQSKTANALFALELDKREARNGIRAFSLHPGIIITNIVKDDGAFHRQLGMVDSNGNPIINPDKGFKTPQQGASTTIFAAVSPLLNNLGGLYLENNDIAHFIENNDPSIPHGVRLHAISDEKSKRLWQVSEELLASRRRD